MDTSTTYQQSGGGYGYTGYGFGGNGIVDLAALALFANGGFGGDRHSSIDVESYLKGKSAGEGAKYEDIVNATSNVNEVSRDGFNSLRTQNEYLASISNANQKELVQLMFNAERQAADCCCETKQLIMAENAKTRDLITENKIEALTAQVSDLKTEALIESKIPGTYVAGAINRAPVATEQCGGNNFDYNAINIAIGEGIKQGIAQATALMGK